MSDLGACLAGGVSFLVFFLDGSCFSVFVSGHGDGKLALDGSGLALVGWLVGSFGWLVGF